MSPLRVEYDPRADAAYIYLTDIAPGGVARSYACDPSEAGAMINLDFDSEGHLLGIEVIGARSHLSGEALAAATLITAVDEP